MGTPATVQVRDVLHLGTAVAKVLEVHRFRSFEDVFREYDHKRLIPDTRTPAAALKQYHPLENYRRLSAEHGVVVFVLGEHAPAPTQVRLAPRQQRANDKAWDCISLALGHSLAATEQERDEARERAWDSGCRRASRHRQDLRVALAHSESLRARRTVLFTF